MNEWLDETVRSRSTLANNETRPIRDCANRQTKWRDGDRMERRTVKINPRGYSSHQDRRRAQRGKGRPYARWDEEA